MVLEEHISLSKLLWANVIKAIESTLLFLFVQFLQLNLMFKEIFRALEVDFPCFQL